MRTRPVQFVFCAFAATAVAVVGTLLLEAQTPFDKRFENCDAAEAEWKLIVKCSARDMSDSPEYVAYYRTRPPGPDADWQMPFEDETVSERWEYVGRLMMSSSFGCSFGPEGGNTTGETYTFVPTDTADGVHLAVSFERSEDDRQTQAGTTNLSIPFRRTTSSQHGPLEYQATWERVK